MVGLGEKATPRDLCAGVYCRFRHLACLATGSYSFERFDWSIEIECFVELSLGLRKPRLVLIAGSHIYCATAMAIELVVSVQSPGI